MLEHVDLNLSVPKEEYKERLDSLHERLYALQGLAYNGRVPVAIVFEGWAAAGKGSCIGILATRLDPRGFRVVSVLPPRTSELAYPWLWRFWQKIPAYGQIVVLDTSWYRRVLIERITGMVTHRQWDDAYADIRDFEGQLAADGAVILKFWLQISKKEQKKRFKKVLADPLTAWQVSDEDQAQHKAYKKYQAAVEEMLVRTETPHAPWTIVAATDRYYTRLKVMETIVQALSFRLESQAALHPPEGGAQPGGGEKPAELAAPPPEKPEPPAKPKPAPATGPVLPAKETKAAKAADEAEDDHA